MRYRFLRLSLLILILVREAKAQNVGLGIAVPMAPLHVAAMQPEIARLENQTALATGINTELWFKIGGNYSGAIKTIGTSGSSARLSFFTYTNSNQANLVERMTILDNGLVGINQTNPTAKFEVNGTFKITDGTQGANKILGCDASGLAAWKADPRENNFGATQTIGLGVSNGVATVIPFNNESHDPGADFTAGVYTVPATGIYHFDTDVISTGVVLVPAGSCWLELWVGAAPVRRVETKWEASSLLPSLDISCDLSLTAGAQVSVKFYQTNGTAASMTIGGNGQTERNPHFTGHRIY